MSNVNPTLYSADTTIFNQFFVSDIIVAEDKDFGTLIFKEKLKSKGLILFRLDDQSSKAKIKALKRVIAGYSDRLSGNFIVVSENKIRVSKIR